MAPSSAGLGSRRMGWQKAFVARSVVGPTWWASMGGGVGEGRAVASDVSPATCQGVCSVSAPLSCLRKPGGQRGAWGRVAAFVVWLKGPCKPARVWPTLGAFHVDTDAGCSSFDTAMAPLMHCRRCGSSACSSCPLDALLLLQSEDDITRSLGSYMSLFRVSCRPSPMFLPSPAQTIVHMLLSS